MTTSLALAFGVGTAAAAPTTINFDSLTEPSLSCAPLSSPLTIGVATFTGGAIMTAVANLPADQATVFGIEVRAGLHTGEVERIGTKIGGLTVNIGARVAELAAPSEILVSQTVRDLMFGSGLSFRERGTYQLKGVPGAWRVYAAARA